MAAKLRGSLEGAEQRGMAWLPFYAGTISSCSTGGRKEGWGSGKAETGRMYRSCCYIVDGAVEKCLDSEYSLTL